MKFLVKKKIILPSLIKLNRYVTNRFKIPIYSNVMILLNKRLLILTVTDLDMEINSNIFLSDIKIIKCGSITVNISKLCDLFNTFNDKDDILIDLINNRLKISCITNTIFLSTLSSSQFPILNKKIFYEHKFSVSFYLLNEIIDSVFFSIGNQDIRYYLNGVLLEYVNGKIFWVSTDGYRMSIYQIDISNYKKINFKNFFSVILSRKLILELSKFSKINLEDFFFFYIYINNIKIKFNNFIIYSKLINGIFPNYEDILISTNINYEYVNLNILEFKNSLMRCLIITNSVNNYVTFIFHNNYLKIISKNINNDQIEEKLIINYFKKKIEISFNIKYILDIINSMNKCDIIRFYFKDSTSIVKINNINRDYINHMIMPIKL